MNRPFSPVHILISLKTILPFLPVTFAVVALTVVFGGLIAVLLAAMNLSKNKVLKFLAGLYIQITRCTPAIVLLFIVFYGIPKFFSVLFGINLYFWPKIIFVVIALSLLYGATLSEIIRSSYLAVGKGQMEAGLSVGLSKFQVLRRIIMPQAIVYALPNFGNSIISLLKEGSLAFTIGLVDVMGAGNLIISRNYGGYGLETYIALTIIYWTVTILIEQIFKALEKHFSRGRINAA